MDQPMIRMGWIEPLAVPSKPNPRPVYPQSHDTPVVERPREPDGDDEWSFCHQKLLFFGSDYGGTDDILRKLVGLVETKISMLVSPFNEAPYTSSSP
jgi:hypothetical protein